MTLINKVMICTVLISSFVYGSDLTSMPKENDTALLFYQAVLVAYFIIIIISIFKGYGENRTIIIFKDYNDLGLTFLVTATPFLIYTLFTSLVGDLRLAFLLALVVTLILLKILIQNSYIDNNKSIPHTLMAVLTKVPLGIIWIFSLISILNPSGKTAQDRRKKRGGALVLLTLLTPIISMLVVEKKGSFFNPKDWVKSRRIGNLRDYI